LHLKLKQLELLIHLAFDQAEKPLMPGTMPTVVPFEPVLFGPSCLGLSRTD
jgi:hypothetical protein